MNLAKPALDVGLYTNQLEPMLAFWQNEAHASFTELLPVGGGVHQHRHAVGDSVIKINHPREPISQGNPTGLKKVTLYGSANKTLTDPDGNNVELKVDGEGKNLRLTLATPRLNEMQAFYGETLALPSPAPNLYSVGASEIELVEGDLGAFERAGVGFRYMTFQVFDVVAEHARIVQSGGQEGMAPVKLGEVAYISFVQDPDQNWIEISQRKSITGSLD